jgi:hypothetical protein
MGGLKMLYQDEGHPGDSWNGVEEFSAGVQPSGRGTDADDQEIFDAAGRAAGK